METFNKLVRDKIPEIIEASGGKAVTRTLDGEEYIKALEQKLAEEVAEVHSAEDDTERKKEMADVYEVLGAIVRAYNYPAEEIARIKEERRTKRGGFEKRILLVSKE